MESLDILKDRLYQLLIEKNGDVKDVDLADIKLDIKDLNIDERQLNRLLQEINSTINWDLINKQKKEKQKKEEELKKELTQKKKNNKNAKQTLNFIIEQCAKDNVFEISEIKIFFETSDELNQDENKSAKLINDYLDSNNYKSFNFPRGKSLRLSLESTPWYKDKLPHIEYKTQVSSTIEKSYEKKPLRLKLILGIVISCIFTGMILFYFLNHQSDIAVPSKRSSLQNLRPNLRSEIMSKASFKVGCLRTGCSDDVQLKNILGKVFTYDKTYEIVLSTSINELEKDINNGKVDILYIGKSSDLQSIIWTSDVTGICCIGIPKGNDELINQFNKIIEK